MRSDPEFAVWTTMVQNGVPEEEVRIKMAAAGLSKGEVGAFFGEVVAGDDEVAAAPGVAVHIPSTLDARMEGRGTVVADWFKIVATASGSIADFSVPVHKRLKSAVASLTGAPRSNIALLIKPGATNTTAATVTLSIGVAFEKGTDDSDDMLRSISASGFGALFCSALEAVGVDVTDRSGVQAQKIGTSEGRIPFSAVFGEAPPEGTDATVMLAAVREMAGKHADPATARGGAFWTFAMLSSIAGVVACLLLFAAVVARRAATPESVLQAALTNDLTHANIVLSPSATSVL
jgi:hypothetical protein